MTGERSRQKRNGSWRREGAESVLQAAGMQLLQTYIDKRQATVVEWVSTWPVFEVYVQEAG